MNSFFTLQNFLEVGKTQDLPSKFWQTLGDALTTFLQMGFAFLFLQKKSKKLLSNGLANVLGIFVNLANTWERLAYMQASSALGIVMLARFLSSARAPAS
jgi:hypothetical protein